MNIKEYITNARDVGFKDWRGLDITSADLNLTFTDKESYLAWVAEWKDGYKKLSEFIRLAKLTCVQLQHAGNPDASDIQGKQHWLRLEARGRLLIRQRAKAYSWELKQASMVAA